MDEVVVVVFSRCSSRRRRLSLLVNQSHGEGGMARRRQAGRGGHGGRVGGAEAKVVFTHIGSFWRIESGRYCSLDLRRKNVSFDIKWYKRPTQRRPILLGNTLAGSKIVVFMCRNDPVHR